MLEMSTYTVYKALNEKSLPYTEVLGHKAITRADVEAYKERTRSSGEKPNGRPKGSTNRKKDATVTR